MCPYFNYQKISAGSNRRTLINLQELQAQTQEKIMRGEFVLPESIIKSYNRDPALANHVEKMIVRLDDYSVGLLISPKYDLMIPAAVLASSMYLSNKYNDAFMLSLAFMYADNHDWALMDSVSNRIYAEGVISPNGISIPNAAALLVIRDIYISNRNWSIEKKLASYTDSTQFSLNCSRLCSMLPYAAVAEAVWREMTYVSKEYAEIINLAKR